MNTLTKSSEGTAQRGWLSRNRVLIALFVVVLVLIPIVPTPEFWITLLNYIGLYSLVALGLVLLTGVGGLTSFGQAAFVGLGAYSTAYLTTQYGVSPWIGLLAGLVITVVSAYVIGLITMRMSGHYLPLATIMAWVIWDEVPSTATLTGMALIIASGLYLGYRELRAARRPDQPPPTAEAVFAPGNPNAQLSLPSDIETPAEP